MWMPDTYFLLQFGMHSKPARVKEKINQTFDRTPSESAPYEPHKSEVKSLPYKDDMHLNSVKVKISSILFIMPTKSSSIFSKSSENATR